MPEQTPIQKIVGDFAPKIAELTDDVLFGDVWERPQLSPRDRSMITLAGLIMGGNTEQMPGHLTRALANGVTPTEISELITHMAFYSGWPKALSAVTVARRVLEV
jgi:4-carboxymuconolactone decarboxylase